MVKLTRLDGRDVIVNAEHILTVERTPDTMLTLTTGAHLMVREPVPDVVDRVLGWRKSWFHRPAEG